MTKKKVAERKAESFKGGSISSSEPAVQNISKKTWSLRSMVKDDDIVPEILKGQNEGWEVFQILPSGSYYSILFYKE